MFKFSQRSLNNLKGVHPDLVKVATKALEYSAVDFVVTEGVRTIERQKQLVAQGKSKTMNSRHITGHAIDIVPVSGSGALLWNQCPDVAQAMFEAAKELGIPIRWGGDWDMDGDSKDEKFYDGPHFELLRSKYP